MSTLRNVTLILTLAALALVMVTLLAHWSLSARHYSQIFGTAEPPFGAWATMTSPLPWRGLSFAPLPLVLGMAVLVLVGGRLAWSAGSEADILRRLAILAMLAGVGAASTGMDSLFGVATRNPGRIPPELFEEHVALVLASLRLGALTATALAVVAFFVRRKRGLAGAAKRTGSLDGIALGILLVVAGAYLFHSYAGTRPIYGYSVTLSEYMSGSIQFSRNLALGLIPVALGLAAGLIPGVGAAVGAWIGWPSRRTPMSARGPLGILTSLSLWGMGLLVLAALLQLTDGRYVPGAHRHLVRGDSYGVAIWGLAPLALLAVISAIVASLATSFIRFRHVLFQRLPRVAHIVGVFAPIALALCAVFQAHALIEAFGKRVRYGRGTSHYDFKEIPESLLALWVGLMLAGTFLLLAIWLRKLARVVPDHVPISDTVNGPRRERESAHGGPRS